MAMSRKHYQAMADEFANVREIASETTTPSVSASVALVDLLAERIANVCAFDNAKFDRARFLEACGFPQSEN